MVTEACLSQPLRERGLIVRRTNTHSILTVLALSFGFATMGMAQIAAAEAPAKGVCKTYTSAPPAVEEALDQVLLQVLDSPFGSAPGAVVSVRRSEWRYVASAGFADPDAMTPMDCASPFQIGSNTKMMTAVVLLQLFEEGLLELDDPLSKHLPEIASRLPNGDAITLRQLALHTSGVFSYTDNAPDGTPGLMEGGVSDRDVMRRPTTPSEMIDFVIEHGEPNFAPGSHGSWSYSNTGYVLLGMVIEKLEARALSKSYENRIFGPLGMDRTYLWNGIPRPSFGLPRAYLTGTEYETSDWNMSQGWAAGGVISTVDDIHVFIEALVRGELFQSPDTLATMQETVPTTNPALLGYGLGLALKGKDLWGHGGQTLRYVSDIAASEDLSLLAFGTSSSNVIALGIAVISNALQSAGALPQ